MQNNIKARCGSIMKNQHAAGRQVALAAALLLAAMLLAGTWPASSLAATHYVTNLDDSGVGSLRQAVADAADGDTIRFTSGLSGTINLASDLSFAGAVSISGAENITLNRLGSSNAQAAKGNSFTLAGNMAMNIHTEASDHGAYGIASSGNLTVNNLSGSITAISKDWGAVALSSSLKLDIGTLSGSLSAETVSSNAIAVNSEDIDIDTLSGSIFVKASNNAYALRSRNTLNIGTMSSSITAKSNGSDVYGIFAERDVDINILSGTISVENYGTLAYGIKNEWAPIIVNRLSGAISAKTDREAYGIVNEEGIQIRTMSGSVFAEADRFRAHAIESTDKVEIGVLSGTVSAKAGKEMAYAIRSKADELAINTLSGTVSATAGDEKATALFSRASTHIETLSGTVSATAGNAEAYGLRSLLSAEIGELSGTVSATAGGADVYGLKIDALADIDTLSGSVSATTKGNTAFAIAAAGLRMNTLSGSVSSTTDGHGAVGIHSAGVLTNGTGGPLEISGTVSAKANGLAMAVSAREAMNLHVTGTISAEDTSGSGKAYAISSGRPWGTVWSAGGNFNDTVTLGSGASITGKIDLAGGANLLTLEDAGKIVGDISNITTMTKRGSGTWDTAGRISTGDLNVDDGTLKVGVTQKAAPTITATGTVTNNGNILFSLADSIAAGDFTALTSAALAGTGTYTTDSIFLTTAVNGNNVDLTKETFASVFAGSGGANSQLAAALDTNYATASGELSDLISTLERSSTLAEAEATLSQMTSLLQMQNMNMSIDAVRFQALATQSRMAEMRFYQTMLAQADSSPDPDDPESWPMVAAIGDLSGLLNRSPEQAPNGLHLRAVGRTGSMDDHDGFSGYDHQTILFSGGYDRVLCDNLLVGISAGYAATGADYNDAGGSTSSLDSYSLGLYGSWFKDAWYVDAILSATYNSYDLKRELTALGVTAEADPNGYTLSAKTEGGYRFALGEWGLTPKASLEYTRFHQDGYTESGAGAASLRMDDTDSGFLESGLGLAVDRAWKTGFGTIIPELSAMWLHEWMEQDREITYTMTGLPATVFSQTTPEAANNALRMGAGARLLLEDGLALTTRYQGELEENARSHSLMVEAQWMF